MSFARNTARLIRTRVSTTPHSIRSFSSSTSSLTNTQRHGTLPGQPGSAITTSLKFFNSVFPSNDEGDNAELKQIPTYRVLDGSGKVLDGAQVPEIDEKFAVRLYEIMMLLPSLDNVLYNAQRQGRISFYMTAHGEEASIVGSAAALSSTDEVMGQYREMGVLLWRGFTLDEVMAQCFSNEDDHGTKGRQMPVHFGSPTHHFHTISSPLATQIPQAAGIAYALKRDPNRRGKDCAACYFGEGAASEGDFHAGLGMASVLGGPLIYICRNNQFAISTPASEQYSGDGIASRGPGYGMDTIRVDGNDVLAVLGAVREARRRALAGRGDSDGGRPVLVELMSYRVGHHSTSDDSFAYRARQEVEDWKKIDNPLHRLQQFLIHRGWWSKEADEELRSRQKKQVLEALKRGEAKSKPPLKELFTDVYATDKSGDDGMPWHLKEQRDELKRLIQKYGDKWDGYKTALEKFKGKGEEFKN
jgi:2-oxoisovalerate dehydrogenase E1 component alpha subunit